METVPAGKADIPEIMRIVQKAKQYMRANGNSLQWVNGYPSEEVFLDDIEKGQLYLMKKDDIPCGVFALVIGKEPTYEVIEGGSWMDDSEYGTIHRIASDGTQHGVFEAALSFSQKKIPHIRVDTHAVNYTMQHVVEKNGFQKCGIIYLANGDPRIAYEKTVKKVF